jgi:uncharacterized protein YjbI with pentapeptide repeats
MLKRVCLVAILGGFTIGFQIQAQETEGPFFYTVVYNRVPNLAPYPLVGLVNVATGNHTGLQAGFYNRNRFNFYGAQLGYVNLVGGQMRGVQAGFVNSSGSFSGAQLGFVNVSHSFGSGLKAGFVNVHRGDFQGFQGGFVNISEGLTSGLQISFVNRSQGFLRGYQAGFVNSAGIGLKGMQIGFVNATHGDVRGVQCGFVNITDDVLSGLQTGFVNANFGGLTGAQLGFVNVSDTAVTGLQIGFVNVASSFSGLQFGFVNVADSISSGIPIGFLSFVKYGGYKAIEVSVSEFYPIGLTFKTGVERFYTGVHVGVNPSFSRNTDFGFIAGSILPMGEGWDFNPEILQMGNMFNSSKLQITALRLQVGYAFSDKFRVVAGPSLAWFTSDEAIAPYFSIWRSDQAKRHQFMLTGRVGLVMRL